MAPPTSRWSRGEDREIERQRDDINLQKDENETSFGIFSLIHLVGSIPTEMAILHALVARGTVVLAEFSATSTNASTIAKQILEKIPGNSDSHVSYSQDRYVFHVKRTDGLTVLCMADENAGSASSSSFISKFFDRYFAC